MFPNIGIFLDNVAIRVDGVHLDLLSEKKQLTIQPELICSGDPCQSTDLVLSPIRTYHIESSPDHSLAGNDQAASPLYRRQRAGALQRLQTEFVSKRLGKMRALSQTPKTAFEAVRLCAVAFLGA
jgi:hypothetical protein